MQQPRNNLDRFIFFLSTSQTTTSVIDIFIVIFWTLYFLSFIFIVQKAISVNRELKFNQPIILVYFVWWKKFSNSLINHEENSIQFNSINI